MYKAALFEYDTSTFYKAYFNIPATIPTKSSWFFRLVASVTDACVMDGLTYLDFDIDVERAGATYRLVINSPAA